MKKLNLLGKAEMKNVLGGGIPQDSINPVGGGGCGDECYDDYDCQNEPYKRCDAVYDQGCSQIRYFCIN